MSKYKEAKEWMGEVLSTAKSTTSRGFSAEDLLKNKSLTREALSKLHCRAYGVVKSLSEEYKESVDSMNEMLYSSTDECKRLTDENAELKGRSALEVVDLQREVVNLQRELLAEKEKQLSELRTTVVQSVGETVKAEIKSYSDIVQKSCQVSSTPLSPASLKSTVRNVFEEEDRSKSVMIFGLPEEKNERLQEKVGDVLLALELTPKFEAYRIGSSHSSENKLKSRPVKLCLGSAAAAKEVLSHAKLLKGSDMYSKVYISADRSIDERRERKTLVLELRRRRKEEPGKQHFIQGGSVHSAETSH